jgi:hypothetical protein
MTEIRIIEQSGYDRDTPGHRIILDGPMGPSQFVLTRVDWQGGEVIRTYEDQQSVFQRGMYPDQDYSRMFLDLPRVRYDIPTLYTTPVGFKMSDIRVTLLDQPETPAVISV